MRDELAALQAAWAATFARYGHHRAGELSYLDILLRFRGACFLYLPAAVWLPVPRRSSTRRCPWRPPLPAACIVRRPRCPPDAQVVEAGSGRRWRSSAALCSSAVCHVGAAAGSTLLFDLLARLPGVVTLGGESHG